MGNTPVVLNQQPEFHMAAQVLVRKFSLSVLCLFGQIDTLIESWYRFGTQARLGLRGLRSQSTDFIIFLCTFERRYSTAERSGV